MATYRILACEGEKWNMSKNNDHGRLYNNSEEGDFQCAVDSPPIYFSKTNLRWEQIHIKKSMLITQGHFLLAFCIGRSNATNKVLFLFLTPRTEAEIEVGIDLPFSLTVNVIQAMPPVLVSGGFLASTSSCIMGELQRISKYEESSHSSRRTAR